MLARVDGLSCGPWRGDDEPAPDTTQGAITCSPDEQRVDRLALIGLRNKAKLREFWNAEIASLGTTLEESAAACIEGVSGTRDWGFGQVACYAGPEGATVRWTDRRTNVYGVADATTVDLLPLYAWWRDEGRKLGRDESTTTETPQASPRPSSGPLVRTPGKPNASVCEDLSEPIVDEWGRTWRVARIQFEERPKYERVILDLQRTGKARNGRETQITVDRKKLSELRNSDTKAPKPRRGSTVLLTRMQGITDAPNLVRFRPGGIELVKELSVAKDGAALRTAQLALAGGACYEVRVPVWGPSATGREKRAQVFIDITR